MTPIVAVWMGSESDREVMSQAANVLYGFGIIHTVDVVSAHRDPEKMYRLAKSAVSDGLKVIIAGAGGAAHLPGMVASLTPLPVIGVPIAGKHLGGLDSLLSIVQMPFGVPVATVAVGGARNAGILAAQILAVGDADLMRRVVAFRGDGF